MKTGYRVDFECTNRVRVRLEVLVCRADERLTVVRCFELQPEVSDSEVEAAFGL